MISSGGDFPVSVAVDHGLVYVLNAEGGGSLQGYRAGFGHLFPIPGSNRALGLPIETPRFTHTPGQVAFSPDGSQVIVTTKAAGSTIDVFGVRAFGLLSSTPVVNPEPHRVAFFLYDLASSFHALWTRGKEEAALRFVIADNPKLTLARLALVRAVGLVIASGLRLIGVEPVEEMR